MLPASRASAARAVHRGHHGAMPNPATRAANRRGIACMCGAMLCFTVNDMLMKKLGEALPLGQLIFMRGFVATLLLATAAQVSGVFKQLPLVLDRRVGFRSLVDALGSLFFLGSLMHLPLANATAINLASPLVMALFAVMFFGERPSRGRWLAIGGGFAGVLLIVQPAAAGFSVWAWVCVASVLCHASRDLLTRGIGASVPALLITLANAVAVMSVAGLLMLVQGVQPVSAAQLALLITTATLLAMAYWLIVQAMRHGELTVVGPFRYVGLLTALLLGFAVWGDVPNALAVGGITLLLAAGVYLLHEQRGAAEAPAEAAR